MLDDHIVMTQSMSFSPYKKPFEERITKWEQQLSLASEILDQWIALQRQWMYLEPIFGRYGCSRACSLADDGSCKHGEECPGLNALG
jgi:Dynein heavy chain, N-terminal region 2